MGKAAVRPNDTFNCRKKHKVFLEGEGEKTPGQTIKKQYKSCICTAVNGESKTAHKMFMGAHAKQTDGQT